MDRSHFYKKQNSLTKLSPEPSQNSKCSSSFVQVSTDRENRVEVQTISIDAITDAIEGVVEHIHNQSTSGKDSSPEESEDLSDLGKTISDEHERFEHSVNMLKSQLFHLKKWDQLEPEYAFHAIDEAHNRADEYTITFRATPILTMIVNAHHKDITDDTHITHTSHMVELNHQIDILK